MSVTRFLLNLVGIVLLLAGFSAKSHSQQLQWESEELKFTPALTGTAVVAHFKFKNVGNEEAKITSVNSSCSCTTPTLKKKNFAPGESGEVTVTFTIGARTGLQEKAILVESNNPQKPVTMLLMKVTIPEVGQLRPTFLYWSPTEPLAPKEIALKIAAGFPMKSITVESSNAKITAKTEVVKLGAEYRIVVTPSETNQPVMAMLSIKTDYPPENPKTFYAHVRVQPKK